MNHQPFWLVVFLYPKGDIYGSCKIFWNEYDLCCAGLL